ncbi:MAG: hypothetical protein ACXW0T_10810 [Methylobacter sp.]
MPNQTLHFSQKLSLSLNDSFLAFTCHCAGIIHRPVMAESRQSMSGSIQTNI